MASLLRSWVWLSAIATASVRAAEDDAPPNVKPVGWDEDMCSCYLTDGDVPEYYTDHAFFDFRSLSEYAGVPDIITDETTSSDADVTSKYFETKEWDDFWKIESWGNRRPDGLSYGAKFPMVNTRNNVFIQENKDKNPASETYLTMRTTRLEEFQGAAQFDSVEQFQFLSIRFLARVMGKPGACIAMFTYLGSEEIADVQEADMEILTREDTDRIHYTNHPAYSVDGQVFPNATRNATLPDDLHWDDWVEHRLDWTPGRSVWYANGIQAANISYQTPRDPSLIIFNVWGDGGVWTENMTVNGQATMDIQWIEMVYNQSSTDESAKKRKRALNRRSSPSTSEYGPRGRLQRREDLGNDQCRMICSIDKGDSAGVVQWVWGNSTASRLLLTGGGFGGGLRFVISWVLGLSALLWYM